MICLTPYKELNSGEESIFDHVMSEAGTEFIDKQIEENESWSKVLEEWKENRKNILVLMDPNEDDDLIDDF